MWDRLNDLERRSQELEITLSQPDVAKNRTSFQQLTKEHKQLQPIVETLRKFRRVEKELADNRQLVNDGDDPSIIAMAKEEIASLNAEIAKLEADLKVLMLPKDPNDEKNVILEIRAGTGGDESALFAAELFRMYSRFVERRGFVVELIEASPGSAGGCKEVIAMVRGDGAFSLLKYERGVHRVQRVPETETQGRVHTSTVTVAVLPEAEEIDVQIQDKDLRIDVYRAGGPGGQSVNTTDSAVRVTHIPTGLVVAMQEEKSQHKNKDKALRVLRARLFEKMQSEQDAARSADRRSQVGTGERAEKIRTYNFPQSRLTDHRIGLTIHNLQEIMGGKLEDVIDPLIAHYQAEALQSGQVAG